MKTVTIRVPGLKVAVPLAADALPRDLVPPDGPAGEPTLELVLGDGALVVRARLNGKNYRKLLKRVAEEGAENVVIVLQGLLKPPAAEVMKKGRLLVLVQSSGPFGRYIEAGR